ncbi:hypothetical protein FHL15_003776 [Xylaria flabelliformis]|uniref:Ubiquitin-related modifier 1 n=2 Tax=Xylaria TaxID=37991 RepID=A0A553I5F5_9PEZI|nr:hypothetical protein FHL15_003776 [Xylaria flabelliformis]
MPVVMMAATTETTVMENTSKIAETPELSIVVEFTYGFPATRASFSSFSSLELTDFISGGLEMLFSDQRRHAISMPATGKNGKPATIACLVDYLCENTMKDTRKELFVLDDHVRPGILVLINDADWELEGEEAYEIQNGDNILFVSTLHGG